MGRYQIIYSGLFYHSIKIIESFLSTNSRLWFELEKSSASSSDSSSSATVPSDSVPSFSHPTQVHRCTVHVHTAFMKDCFMEHVNIRGRFYPFHFLNTLQAWKRHLLFGGRFTLSNTKKVKSPSPPNYIRVHVDSLSPHSQAQWSWGGRESFLVF